jgi:CheY-like chemotaxis protein
VETSLPPTKTILLVDDVDTCRLTTKWFLESLGYNVHSARSAEEALARFDPKVHDAIITDNSMPGLTGAAMARFIKKMSPSTPIIMYSGTPPEDRSCFELVIPRPAHLLVLKDALDAINCRASHFAPQPPSSPPPDHNALAPRENTPSPTG